MTRRLLVGAIWASLAGYACGGAGSDGDGDDTQTGSGSGSGGSGLCDVRDGRDEYLDCVCEEAKPCVGFPPGECKSIIRSPLKYAQHDAGLDCVQAVGDFYECQFALSCPQVEELNDYWNYCWEDDPSGQGQPYCRRQTLEVVETCKSFEFPCTP